MLRHELYSMIHVPRRKNEYAAELFLGPHIGAVRGRHVAVLPVQGQDVFRRLKRFDTSPVPVGTKMVVVIKARVDHGVSLTLRHPIEVALGVVAKTEVFHCAFPLASAWEQASWLVAAARLCSGFL